MSDQQTYSLAEWLAKELAAARRENATLREALEQADADLKRCKIVAEAATVDEPIWHMPNEIAGHVGAARARIAAALAASPAAEEPQP